MILELKRLWFYLFNAPRIVELSRQGDFGVEYERLIKLERQLFARKGQHETVDAMVL